MATNQILEAIGNQNFFILVNRMNELKLNVGINSTLGELKQVFLKEIRFMLKGESSLIRNSYLDNKSYYNYVDQSEFGILKNLNDDSNVSVVGMSTTKDEQVDCNVFDNIVLIQRPFDSYIKLLLLSEIYYGVKKDASSAERDGAAKVIYKINSSIKNYDSIPYLSSLFVEKAVVVKNGNLYLTIMKNLFNDSIGGVKHINSIDDRVKEMAFDYNDNVINDICASTGFPYTEVMSYYNQIDSGVDLYKMNNEIMWYEISNVDGDIEVNYPNTFLNYINERLPLYPSHFALAYQQARKEENLTASDWFKGLNSLIRDLAGNFPGLNSVHKQVDELYYINTDFDEISGLELERFIEGKYKPLLPDANLKVNQLISSIFENGFTNIKQIMSNRNVQINMDDSNTVGHVLFNGESATFGCSVGVGKLIRDILLTDDSDIYNIINLSNMICMLPAQTGLEIKADGTIVLSVNRLRMIRRLGCDVATPQYRFKE